MASDEKLSWIKAQYTKYIPLLKRSKDDIARSGRTSSETYSGLEDRCEDTGEEAIHLPEEVANFKSQSSVLRYFIHLSKNDEEQINFQTIDSLLAQGANVNEVDRHGQTVMHEVCKSWHTEVAQFLIKRHADINKPDRYGVTPLHVAAAMDYPDMIAFLLKQGANISAVTNGKQTPLHYAAKYDAVHSLKVLLKHDADTNARDHKQRTALHLASELDRSEAARLMLNLKCDASVQDDTGLSCLTMMVVNMPPVATQALDQFLIKDRANRKQHFYLNLVEPSTSGFKETQAKSPLEVIVQSRQLDIIMHPVIQKLIEVKWRFFGRKNISIMLSLNLLFIISWTALGIASSLPRTEDAPYKFPEDAWRIIVICIALGLTLYQIVEEFKEIYQSKVKMNLWKEWRKKELERDFKYCHPMWPEEKEYLQKGIDDLQDIQPAYFKDFWNVFDWIVYFLLLAVIVTHIADVIVQNNADLHVSHVRVFAVTIIFIWLRLMKHARAIRLLGPFIVMLGKIVTDVLKFLFLYGEFYIPYACAFWIIFGGKVHNMATVPQMLFTIFRITLVDDYNFGDMYAVDPVMAYILCGTFLGVSSILCINLLIALLADTFQRVYDNATANAVMQQATMLLQIEEGLSKKNKSKFDQYMRTSCAPLSLFYDDDLTIDQDDDLKKVTMHIREELGELMQLVKEQKLKNELSGMQKKRSNHGNMKSSSKLHQTNSLQSRVRLQPPSSESSQSLSMLIENQQEQSTALEQMNQRLRSLERMIRHSLQANAPPGSSSTADWEQVNIQAVSRMSGDREYHPSTAWQVDEPNSHVTVDIIGRTDQSSQKNE
ncbi:LOW QUALITY PROTEIN: transient receptor potential channel pyrexia-like [Bufo gargarizans]|uniref:LOW QUALITY PROTEIN: transient receptor potential channel pyrexia-like n=1 Tax=Bufo gargarizans TaxID=30331 RepID=UPI001CF23B62|nr:LOW QUALITY PROTEIN: transient receptor potential channel pyrexia-like [Bufo gargarizans]